MYVLHTTYAHTPTPMRYSATGSWAISVDTHRTRQNACAQAGTTSTRNLVSVAPSSVLPPPSSSPLPPFSSSLLVLAWGLSDKESWCKHSEKLVESLQKQLIGLWRYTWEILSQAACNPTRRWRPNRSVGDVVVIESYSYYYRWYKQEWHNRKIESEDPSSQTTEVTQWSHDNIGNMLIRCWYSCI